MVQSRKDHIKYIDYLSDKYGLLKDQRHRLHDAITKEVSTRQQIEEEAEEMARTSKPKPQRGRRPDE
ncbi:MAG: hypothetical protein NVS2B7_16410 [Herpetosiphon sp.]